MEADWEIEIGGDAPVIETYWPGFVDLRISPERICEIAETGQLQGLAEGLTRLNSRNSPVWTCKTDVFEPDRIDADELDAPPDRASCAIACYIDLLMRVEQRWNTPAEAEDYCKLRCAYLREIPLGCCRVDLVIRRAMVGPETEAFGTTAYLTACGRSSKDARSGLGKCLAAFVAAVVPATTGIQVTE
jgi:hypothetical protein